MAIYKKSAGGADIPYNRVRLNEAPWLQHIFPGLTVTMWPTEEKRGEAINDDQMTTSNDCKESRGEEHLVRYYFDRKFPEVYIYCSASEYASRRLPALVKERPHYQLQACDVTTIAALVHGAKETWRILPGSKWSENNHVGGYLHPYGRKKRIDGERKRLTAEGYATADGLVLKAFEYTKSTATEIMMGYAVNGKKCLRPPDAGTPVPEGTTHISITKTGVIIYARKGLSAEPRKLLAEI